MQRSSKWIFHLIQAIAFLMISFVAFFLSVKRPMIEFSSDSLDLGTTAVGVPVSGFFTISNTGNAKLTLSPVKASCTCTSAKLGDLELLPGRSTNLLVTMTTNGGPQEAMVVVNSNSSINPTVILRVKVSDSKPIRIERNVVDLGYLDPDVEVYSGVVVIDTVDDAIILEHSDFVSRDSPTLTVTISKQASKRFHLQYTFTPSLFCGDIDSHVDFSSDRHGSRERISFVGNIKSRLFAHTEPVRVKTTDLSETTIEIAAPIALLPETLIKKVEFIGRDGVRIAGDFAAGSNGCLAILTLPKSLADSRVKNLGYLTVHGHSRSEEEVLRIPVTAF